VYRSYLHTLFDQINFYQEKENKKFHYSHTIRPDSPTGYLEFINAIREQEYPCLDFESIYYPHLHFEIEYPTAFADGIKFIFED